MAGNGKLPELIGHIYDCAIEPEKWPDVLGQLVEYLGMLSAAFDLLTIRIILVDAKSRIVHANNVGRKLLDERSAIRRDGDYLSCRDPKTATELARAIQNASGGASARFPRSGIALPISTVRGSDLAAWVLPLDG